MLLACSAVYKHAICKIKTGIPYWRALSRMRLGLWWFTRMLSITQAFVAICHAWPTGALISLCPSRRLACIVKEDISLAPVLYADLIRGTRRWRNARLLLLDLGTSLRSKLQTLDQKTTALTLRCILLTVAPWFLERLLHVCKALCLAWTRGGRTLLLAGFGDYIWQCSRWPGAPWVSLAHI